MVAVASLDPPDISERTVGESEVLTAADADLTWMPPRRERRAPHVFQRPSGPRDGSDANVACATCGYGEAGHPALTEPEQEVVADLLNRRQAPPLMRRSILRKLTSRLHRVR